MECGSSYPSLGTHTPIEMVKWSSKVAALGPGSQTNWIQSKHGKSILSGTIIIELPLYSALSLVHVPFYSISQTKKDRRENEI